jgi:hypothetical protein
MVYSSRHNTCITGESSSDNTSAFLKRRVRYIASGEENRLGHAAAMHRSPNWRRWEYFVGSGVQHTRRYCGEVPDPKDAPALEAAHHISMLDGHLIEDLMTV